MKKYCNVITILVALQYVQHNFQRVVILLYNRCNYNIFTQAY